MGKVITVWGSPGSGKSMFSCILAKALTRDKRKAIIINAEISVPMLPVWLPDQIIAICFKRDASGSAKLQPLIRMTGGHNFPPTPKQS